LTKEIPRNDALILLVTAPMVLLVQAPYQSWYKWVHTIDSNVTNQTKIPYFRDYPIVVKQMLVQESNNHFIPLVSIGIVFLGVILYRLQNRSTKKPKQYKQVNITEKVKNISF
jgi:hypothetical protein